MSNVLDIEELLDLETSLSSELEDHLTEILTRLNRSGQLETLLELLGMSDLLQISSGYKSYPTGKILVIGDTKTSAQELLSIGKKLGIDKKRFELHLDYKDAKKFDFRNIQYSPSYSIIMVGPMPHSGMVKGDFGGIIAAIEQQDGYPPVIRMGSNELKITKSNFRNTLEDLLSSGQLVA